VRFLINEKREEGGRTERDKGKVRAEGKREGGRGRRGEIKEKEKVRDGENRE